MRGIHRGAFRLIGVMLVVLASTASAQAASLDIERVAARALLNQLNITGPVAVHPVLAKAGTAPPVYDASSRLRPEARSRSLARDLGGTVRRLTEARDCARCALKGIEAVVTLSEPVMAGSDTATITATAIYNTGHSRMPTAYLTMSYLIVRNGSMWKILRERRLGES